MARKHEGMCPFCGEVTQPIVLEKNRFRRDKCECTNCNKIIYRCRNFFCNDYAKSGIIYDDELCPACSNGLSDAASKLPGKIREAAEAQQKKR